MGIRYTRLLGPPAVLQPGQYTVETASGWPVLACRACGGIFDLPAGHTYSRGGAVTPRLACVYASCAEIEYVTLGDVSEAVIA